MKARNTSEQLALGTDQHRLTKKVQTTTILPTLLLLLVSGVQAQFTNSTTLSTSTSTSTLTSITSTSSAPPQPTGYRMECAGTIQDICQDLCQCSGGRCACHADPTSRCQMMCKCIPT